MLHRSNAEDALWKQGGSRGGAAGQLRGGARGRAGVETWPGAVFEGAGGAPDGREDLPESLRKTTHQEPFPSPGLPNRANSPATLPASSSPSVKGHASGSGRGSPFASAASRAKPSALA